MNPVRSAAGKLLLRRAVFLALLCSALCAHPTRAAGDVRILTSFYPMHIAALNVAKDVPGVRLDNLSGPMTGCLHDYQMTPADLGRLSRADILVVNGAGAEGFLDKVVRELPRLKVIRASEGIPLLGAGVGKDPNAHVWLSVSLHIRQVENIAEGLSRLDPARAPEYRKNAAAYVAKLEKLRADLREGLKDLRTRDIVTFHEAFPYFAQEFGFNILAVIEREPGSEPNARELAETVATVRKSGGKVLFVEPQYPAKAAETVARETGAALYALDPAVTGPVREDAYLAIMERNLEELRKALR